MLPLRNGKYRGNSAMDFSFASNDLVDVSMSSAATERARHDRSLGGEAYGGTEGNNDMMDKDDDEGYMVDSSLGLDDDFRWNNDLYRVTNTITSHKNIDRHTREEDGNETGDDTYQGMDQLLTSVDDMLGNPVESIHGRGGLGESALESHSVFEMDRRSQISKKEIHLRLQSRMNDEAIRKSQLERQERNKSKAGIDIQQEASHRFPVSRLTAFSSPSSEVSIPYDNHATSADYVKTEILDNPQFVLTERSRQRRTDPSYLPSSESDAPHVFPRNVPHKSIFSNDDDNHSLDEMIRAIDVKLNERTDHYLFQAGHNNNPYEINVSTSKRTEPTVARIDEYDLTSLEQDNIRQEDGEISLASLISDSFGRELADSSHYREHGTDINLVLKNENRPWSASGRPDAGGPNEVLFLSLGSSSEPSNSRTLRTRTKARTNESSTDISEISSMMEEINTAHGNKNREDVRGSNLWIGETRPSTVTSAVAVDGPSRSSNGRTYLDKEILDPKNDLQQMHSFNVNSNSFSPPASGNRYENFQQQHSFQGSLENMSSSKQLSSRSYSTQDEDDLESSLELMILSVENTLQKAKEKVTFQSPLSPASASNPPPSSQNKVEPTIYPAHSTDRKQIIDQSTTVSRESLSLSLEAEAEELSMAWRRKIEARTAETRGNISDRKGIAPPEDVFYLSMESSSVPRTSTTSTNSTNNLSVSVTNLMDVIEGTSDKINARIESHTKHSTDISHDKETIKSLLPRDNIIGNSNDLTSNLDHMIYTVEKSLGIHRSQIQSPLSALEQSSKRASSDLHSYNLSTDSAHRQRVRSFDSLDEYQHDQGYNKEFSSDFGRPWDTESRDSLVSESLEDTTGLQEVQSNRIEKRVMIMEGISENFIPSEGAQDRSVSNNPVLFLSLPSSTTMSVSDEAGLGRTATTGSLSDTRYPSNPSSDLMVGNGNTRIGSNEHSKTLHEIAAYSNAITMNDTSSLSSGVLLPSHPSSASRIIPNAGTIQTRVNTADPIAYPTAESLESKTAQYSDLSHFSFLNHLSIENDGEQAYSGDNAVRLAARDASPHEYDEEEEVSLESLLSMTSSNYVHDSSLDIRYHTQTHNHRMTDAVHVKSEKELKNLSHVPPSIANLDETILSDDSLSHLPPYSRATVTDVDSPSIPRSATKSSSPFTHITSKVSATEDNISSNDSLIITTMTGIKHTINNSTDTLRPLQDYRSLTLEALSDESRPISVCDVSSRVETAIERSQGQNANQTDATPQSIFAEQHIDTATKRTYTYQDKWALQSDSSLSDGSLTEDIPRDISSNLQLTYSNAESNQNSATLTNQSHHHQATSPSHLESPRSHSSAGVTITTGYGRSTASDARDGRRATAAIENFSGHSRSAAELLESRSMISSSPSSQHTQDSLSSNSIASLLSGSFSAQEKNSRREGSSSSHVLLSSNSPSNRGELGLVTHRNNTTNSSKGFVNETISFKPVEVLKSPNSYNTTELSSQPLTSTFSGSLQHLFSSPTSESKRSDQYSSSSSGQLSLPSTELSHQTSQSLSTQSSSHPSSTSTHHSSTPASEPSSRQPSAWQLSSSQTTSNFDWLAPYKTDVNLLASQEGLFGSTSKYQSTESKHDEYPKAINQSGMSQQPPPDHSSFILEYSRIIPRPLPQYSLTQDPADNADKSLSTSKGDQSFVDLKPQITLTSSSTSSLYGTYISSSRNHLDSAGSSSVDYDSRHRNEEANALYPLPNVIATHDTTNKLYSTISVQNEDAVGSIRIASVNDNSKDSISYDANRCNDSEISATAKSNPTAQSSSLAYQELADEKVSQIVIGDTFYVSSTEDTSGTFSNVYTENHSIKSSGILSESSMKNSYESNNLGMNLKTRLGYESKPSLIPNNNIDNDIPTTGIDTNNMNSYCRSNNEEERRKLRSFDLPIGNINRYTSRGIVSPSQQEENNSISNSEVLSDSSFAALLLEKKYNFDNDVNNEKREEVPAAVYSERESLDLSSPAVLASIGITRQADRQYSEGEESFVQELSLHDILQSTSPSLIAKNNSKRQQIGVSDFKDQVSDTSEDESIFANMGTSHSVVDPSSLGIYSNDSKMTSSNRQDFDNANALKEQFGTFQLRKFTSSPNPSDNEYVRYASNNTNDGELLMDANINAKNYNSRLTLLSHDLEELTSKRASPAPIPINNNDDYYKSSSMQEHTIKSSAEHPIDNSLSCDGSSSASDITIRSQKVQKTGHTSTFAMTSTTCTHSSDSLDISIVQDIPAVSLGHQTTGRGTPHDILRRYVDPTSPLSDHQSRPFTESEYSPAKENRRNLEINLGPNADHDNVHMDYRQRNWVADISTVRGDDDSFISKTFEEMLQQNIEHKLNAVPTNSNSIRNLSPESSANASVCSDDYVNTSQNKNNKSDNNASTNYSIISDSTMDSSLDYIEITGPPRQMVTTLPQSNQKIITADSISQEDNDLSQSSYAESSITSSIMSSNQVKMIHNNNDVSAIHELRADRMISSPVSSLASDFDQLSYKSSGVNDNAVATILQVKKEFELTRQSLYALIEEGTSKSSSKETNLNSTHILLQSQEQQPIEIFSVRDEERRVLSQALSQRSNTGALGMTLDSEKTLDHLLFGSPKSSIDVQSSVASAQSHDELSIDDDGKYEIEGQLNDYDTLSNRSNSFSSNLQHEYPKGFDTKLSLITSSKVSINDLNTNAENASHENALQSQSLSNARSIYSPPGINYSNSNIIPSEHTELREIEYDDALRSQSSYVYSSLGLNSEEENGRDNFSSDQELTMDSMH